MKITLLSRGIGVHTTRRLAEAAETLGHRVQVLDPAQIQMGLVRGHARLFLNEKAIGRTDVVISRVAASMSAYGLALVRQFEASGTPVLNRAAAIETARNKMRLLQLLTSQSIQVPPAIVGRGAIPLKRMVDMVGGFPVAIKIVHPRFGIIICESAQSMEAAAEAVLSMGHDLIVQRYVDPTRGRDLRALVLCGEVIASVRRQPTAGKLHHALSTGAGITAARLTPSQRRMAVATARVVGLDLAAVDLLELRSGGTQVFDVHASPGLRDLEEASGADLAVPIVRCATALATGRRGRSAAAGITGNITRRNGNGSGLDH